MRNKRYIKKVTKEYVKVKNTIAKLDDRRDSDLKIQILLSPYEIMELYRLELVFEDLQGDVPSFHDRFNFKIKISEKYRDDDYAIRQLCAHELGHFFLHKKAFAEMNNFKRKEIEEYEANIFSILLMPQIMKGVKWQKMKPKELNEMMYNKIKKC